MTNITPLNPVAEPGRVIQAEMKQLAQDTRAYMAAIKHDLASRGMLLIEFRTKCERSQPGLFDSMFKPDSDIPEFRMSIVLRDALMEAAPKGSNAITEDIICDFLKYVAEEMK